jgi:hypothetical protein
MMLVWILIRILILKGIAGIARGERTQPVMSGCSVQWPDVRKRSHASHAKIIATF